MKIESNRKLCIAGAIAIVVLAFPLSAIAAERPADAESAIAASWRDHIEAAQRKDLAAVMEIYADDVIYIIPGVMELHGKAALEESEAQTLASADVLEAVHTVDNLRVYGDLAYELGTVAGPVRPKGGEPQTVTFHFMATWRRGQDGAWRIECMVGEAESP